MADSFVPGNQLSAALARMVEEPLRSRLPGVPLVLAFIGPGSDVLGYDTPRSMDHDWGPRLTVLVPDEIRENAAAAVDDVIAALPAAVGGHPLRYSRHHDGTLNPDPAGTEHRVEVDSFANILERTFLVRDWNDVSDAVWVCTPMQSLLEFTGGAVFVDDTCELTKARESLAFYPNMLWRYQLAALWMRVSQVNPFVGRTGEVDDEAGSAVIASSIARDLMRIGLVQSRSYAPYSKWLGTAFARTEVGRYVTPVLRELASATDWRAREALLNRAGELLIRQLNALALIALVSPEAERFHSRPFHVVRAEQVAEALHASLEGTDAERWPPFLGGIDVITDSTDALKNAGFRRSMVGLFSGGDTNPGR